MEKFTWVQLTDSPVLLVFDMFSLKDTAQSPSSAKLNVVFSFPLRLAAPLHWEGDSDMEFGNRVQVVLAVLRKYVIPQYSLEAKYLSLTV